ncbi:MAG: arsenic-transporting ATPase [Cyanobacteria bacterium RYN_339]|nr:arsenic-transporting ATPase [Cyanobacteria bacterium RYN_339]
MRIILMCGKGGVGKSTLAAALGARSAAVGQRTLVYSVDPAHSLAWTFDQAVGGTPTPLGPNLWAAELEALSLLDDQWGDLRGYLDSVIKSQGFQQGAGAELASLPGVHEFAALLRLKQHADSKQFDVIIVDHAPTAFALRLLSLPDVMGFYAKHGKRLWERYGAQMMMALPMLGANIPLPTGGMIGKGLETLELLRGLPALLADPAVTSARLVLTPETPALDEARNLYAHLSLYGITTDQVLVNRLLPAAVVDPFFAEPREREQGVRARAQAEFAPVAVSEVEMLAQEPRGIAKLTAFGEQVWPSSDATARQTQDLALRVTQDGEQVMVDIKLPFVTAKDVDLAKFENELYITIGQHRRNLVLPPETTDMQPVKAKFAEGRLLVTLARTS